MNQTTDKKPEPKEVRDATLDGLKRIYLIIIGLAIAQALTRAFTEHDILAPHLAQLSLLGAFLPTAIRFAHGSVLHLSVLSGVQKWRWDMLGLLLQAVLFFVAALALDNLTLFVSFYATIFILDTVWLLILAKGGHPLSHTERQWVTSNVVQLLFIALLMVLVWRVQLSEIAVAIALAVAAFGAAWWDYSHNCEHYFPAQG